MLVEFIFQQQTFVEYLYRVTKIVPGIKWCAAMLYRILQSVVLLGQETLFSDNMISGKKRPGLETNKFSTVVYDFLKQKFCRLLNYIFSKKYKH